MAETDLREDLITLSNLGQGIFENGFKEGYQRGLEAAKLKDNKERALDLHEKGYDIDVIFKALDETHKQVKEWLKIPLS
ncbi:MAG: hypothetical protein LUF29_04070 [Oscillospiraceae bacterium]|nr:hypothetical protein [Oscillospiraceae bacterium]